MSMRFADATAGMRRADTAPRSRPRWPRPREPYTDEDGAIAIPARTWTAVATA